MIHRRLLLGLVVLVALTILAHHPALEAGFIWDDDAYVTQNDALRDPGGLEAIWFHPGATPQFYPLVFTSYWLEHRLWNLDPFGYHLVNIILHALVACLLWVVLRELNLRVAWLAAAVFAIHPVQVESVAWITERKNVLSGFFYLASLLLFFRACSPFRAGSAAAVRRSLYGGSLLLFLCALSSKTVTCSLPAVILLLVWWKRGALNRRILGLTAPYFGVGLIFAGMTIWMERYHVGAQGTEWSLNLLDRVLIAGRALAFYTAKLLLPVDLAFIYVRWQVDSTAWWQYLYPGGVLLTLFVLWKLRFRIGRGPLAAALIFAATLFPALGFVDVYPMRYSFVADHFQYLASAAMIVLVLSAFHSGIQRSGGRLRQAALGTSTLLICVLGVLTWSRAQTFRDPEALWSDTLSKNPTSWMVHHNLGMAYEAQGKWQDCVEQYRAAIRLRPDLAQSYFNLGTVQAKQGDWAPARANFEKAISCEPDYPDAYVSLANVLYLQGDVASAIEGYRHALRIDPHKLSAYKNLARALRKLKRWSEAAAHYREILRIDPEDTEAMSYLAWILATAPDDSVRSGAEALDLAQRLCEATGFRHGPSLVALAAAYAEMGRFDRAVATIDRAIALAEDIGTGSLLEELQASRERYESNQPTRSR
jgi:tetratricopeptide (TPR) repeat protein